MSVKEDLTLGERLCRMNAFYSSIPNPKLPSWNPVWVEPTEEERAVDTAYFKDETHADAVLSISTENTALAVVETPGSRNFISFTPSPKILFEHFRGLV